MSGHLMIGDNMKMSNDQAFVGHSMVI